MYIANENGKTLKVVSLRTTSDVYTNGTPSVVLLINDIEIAYFDDDGLNLLPNVPVNLELPLDKDGYIKIVKG